MSSVSDVVHEMGNITRKDTDAVNLGRFIEFCVLKVYIWIPKDDKEVRYLLLPNVHQLI
jgi:hypothetical protein